jgi:hypothetical protein
MNDDASSLASQWWVRGVNGAERVNSVTTDIAALPAHPGSSASFGAGAATRLFRWARAVLRRWQRNEPRTREDVLALADSVEREMPNLAAELRFIARHRPAASQEELQRPELASIKSGGVSWKP